MNVANCRQTGEYALASVTAYLDRAAAAEVPKEAAEWTLAAKNAASVALTAVQAELSALKALPQRVYPKEAA